MNLKEKKRVKREFEKLEEKLVPGVGEASTTLGEVVRCIGNLEHYMVVDMCYAFSGEWDNFYLKEIRDVLGVYKPIKKPYQIVLEFLDEFEEAHRLLKQVESSCLADGIRSGIENIGSEPELEHQFFLMKQIIVNKSKAFA